MLKGGEGKNFHFSHNNSQNMAHCLIVQQLVTSIQAKKVGKKERKKWAQTLSERRMDKSFRYFNHLYR